MKCDRFIRTALKVWGVASEVCLCFGSEFVGCLPSFNGGGERGGRKSTG